MSYSIVINFDQMRYLLLQPFTSLFPGQPAPERQTILDFTGATDGGVAVASAGPYANHLHLAADR